MVVDSEHPLLVDTLLKPTLGPELPPHVFILF
jgi:hypothetical protein